MRTAAGSRDKVATTLHRNRTQRHNHQHHHPRLILSVKNRSFTPHHTPNPCGLQTAGNSSQSRRKLQNLSQKRHRKRHKTHTHRHSRSNTRRNTERSTCSRRCRRRRRPLRCECLLLPLKQCQSLLSLHVDTQLYLPANSQALDSSIQRSSERRHPSGDDGGPTTSVAGGHGG